MTFIDIYNELQNASKKEKQVEAFINPIEAADVSVPVLNLPTKLTKNQRTFLSKVLAFIDMKKQVRIRDVATLMNISCKNKRLLSITGSVKNSSNFIRRMANLGLISVVDDTYQFNAYYSKQNHSKRYAYHYKNEVLIKKYCKQNSINIYKPNKNYNNNTIVESFSIDSFETDEVKFSNHLLLHKPDDYSVSEFEAYLTQALYKNYPQLSKYQQMADLINDTFYVDDADRQIRFVPSFTWNKGNNSVIKIGIRATNTLVSAKKDKDGSENFYGIYKEDVLLKYGFNLEKDVKSSVPRITYLLNNKEWLSEDIDIYQNIYNEYLKINNNNNNNTIVESFSEVREAIKGLHMRGYFDNETMMAVHISNKVKLNYDSVKDEMSKYRQAIISAEGGNTFGSEVFFHESCIYLDVLYELLKKGFDVLQIYDAFYSKKEGMTNEEFETLVRQIVENKAIQYINNYQININNTINKYNNLTNNNNNTIVESFSNNEKTDILSLVEQALADDEVELEEAVNELKLLN